MKLLLDTHAFLWFIMGSPNLSADARTLIEDAANEKFLSVASLWEIAIKLSIGKLTLSAPFDLFISFTLSAAQQLIQLAALRLPLIKALWLRFA